MHFGGRGQSDSETICPDARRIGGGAGPSGGARDVLGSAKLKPKAVHWFVLSFLPCWKLADPESPTV
jgi:hypothetical protein